MNILEGVDRSLLYFLVLTIISSAIAYGLVLKAYATVFEISNYAF